MYRIPIRSRISWVQVPRLYVGWFSRVPLQPLWRWNTLGQYLGNPGIGVYHTVSWVCAETDPTG